MDDVCGGLVEAGVGRKGFGIVWGGDGLGPKPPKMLVVVCGVVDCVVGLGSGCVKGYGSCTFGGCDPWTFSWGGCTIAGCVGVVSVNVAFLSLSG